MKVHEIYHRLFIENAGNIYIFLSMCIMFLGSVLICLDFRYVPLCIILGIAFFGYGIIKRSQRYSMYCQAREEEELTRYKLMLSGGYVGDLKKDV